MQGVLHHQLVDAVGLQAAQVLQKVRRLHTRSPHHQLGLHHPPIGQTHPVGHHFRDLGLGQHLHTQARDQRLTCRRQARRQGRQDAVGRLNQADLDVLVRVNPVQAKSHHLARRAVQLGGQLHAGCARADDGHMQLALVDVGGLGVRADAGIHHLGVELLGIVLRLQAQGIFLHALRAEVVAQAADANHQGVVANLLDRGDRQPVAVHVRGQVNRIGLAVQPFELADAECEVIPVRLRHVTNLMVPKVHATGGNFMQLRFPDVGPVFVHQGDIGLCAAPIGFSKAGSEFQAAGSPADDDDFVFVSLHASSPSSSLRDP